MLPSDAEIDTQYERIVRLIPVNELQSSYNSVLQDEFSSVNRSVDDLVAALSHLKEVRDAVSKLQQVKPQYSASLLKAMDKTIIMQQELEIKLQKMQLVDAVQLKRKRQRPLQSSRNETTEGSLENSESESSDSDSESSSESEDEAIAIGPRLRLLNQQTANKQARMKKTRVRNEEDVESCVGGLFTGGSALSSSLETENAVDTRSSRILNLLPPAESKEAPLRLVNSERQHDTVKTSKQYMRMVGNVDRMSALERYTHIREVLLELTDVVNQYGSARLNEQQAVTIMKYVVQWPSWDYTAQKSLLDVYQSFLTAMIGYEEQVMDTKEKPRLKGLNAKLSRILKQNETHTSGKEESKRSTLKPKNDEPVSTKAFSPCDKVTAENAPMQPSKPTIAATSQDRPPVVKAAKPSSYTANPSTYYTTMIKNMKQMAMQRRVQCIPHALLQLKKVMLTDDGGEHKTQIPDAIVEVLEWILNGYDVQHNFGSYHDFATVLFSYAAQHPESESLQRVTNQFAEVVDKLSPGPSNANAAKSVNAPPHHIEAKPPSAEEVSVARVTTKNLDAEVADEPHPNFVRVVEELATMNFETRSTRLSEMIIAVRGATSGDIKFKLLDSVTQAMKRVETWVLSDPSSTQAVGLYASLFKSLAAYSTRIQAKVRTAELDRILVRISEKLVKESQNRSRSNAEPIVSKSDSRQGEGSVSGVVGGDVIKKHKEKTEPESESESESESDYDDEKEAVGGSEAAWSAFIATVAHEDEF